MSPYEKALEEMFAGKTLSEEQRKYEIELMKKQGKLYERIEGSERVTEEVYLLFKDSNADKAIIDYLIHLRSLIEGLRQDVNTQKVALTKAIMVFTLKDNLDKKSENEEMH